MSHVVPRVRRSRWRKPRSTFGQARGAIGLELRTRVIDAGVLRVERLQHESLPNQDGTLSGRDVSSLDAFDVSPTFFATCADDSNHESESELHMGHVPRKTRFTQSTLHTQHASHTARFTHSTCHSCVDEEIECVRTNSRSPPGEVVAAVQGASAVHRDLACLIGRARRSRRAIPFMSP